MSDENEEITFPVSITESMFLELHVEYEAAINAGFTKQQAFALIKILFESRVQSVFHDIYTGEENDDE